MFYSVVAPDSDRRFRPTRMLAAAIASATLQELGVTVSVYSDGIFRVLLRSNEFLPEFETEHQSELARWRYNDRCIRKAQASGRPVLGEHRGAHDWFVPVQEPGSFLVVGPFFRERSTSTDVARRWRAISRSRANLADPSFSRYVTATLATLVLPGSLADELGRLLLCFGQLMCGQGDPPALTRQVDQLATRLLTARSAEIQWTGARNMVDPRTSHLWPVAPKDPLDRLGMKGPPEHVLVGLFTGRADEPDRIDEVLRRDACQRAVTELWRRRGNVCTGQIGNNGIVLVVGPGLRSRSRLVDIAASSAAVVRKSGFTFHAGIARGDRKQSLATLYRNALASAHTALSRGQAIAFAEDAAFASVRSLGELRADLPTGFAAASEPHVARFERYAEAVLSRSGHQLDAVRAHLEAGLDRLVEPLLASGALVPQAHRDLLARVQTGPEITQSLSELLATYRAVVVDIESGLARPASAQRTRSVSRALAFVKDHLSEPLTLAAVAKVAGFAPTYFSKIWKSDQGTTFERSILALRLDRAKRALETTELSVGRVAALTGFRCRTHFQQAFKRSVKMTPIEYRRATKIDGPATGARAD